VRLCQLVPLFASIIVGACDDGVFEALSPEGLASHLTGEALENFDTSSGTFILPQPSGVMAQADAEATALLLATGMLRPIVVGTDSGDVSLCGTYYSHTVYEDPPGYQREDALFGGYWIVHICASGTFEATAIILGSAPVSQYVPEITRNSYAINIRDMEPLLSAEEAASVLIRFFGEDVRLAAVPRLINGLHRDGFPGTYARWEFPKVEFGDSVSAFYVGRFNGNGDRTAARDEFLVMRAVSELRRGLVNGRHRIGPDRFELVEGQ